MPPLKGIDRGINGEMLKALEEIGHGAQIAVVDASYDIPVGSQVVNYQGDSTAQALEGILKLVPIDEDKNVISLMGPDDHGAECPALRDELAVTQRLGLQAGVIKRLGEPSAAEWSGGYLGFYRIANNPEVHTLFVRTRDEKAYACAQFIVGHSQS